MAATLPESAPGLASAAGERTMESRTGRSKQRYNADGKRLVAGVVPVSEDRQRVLLIQSTRRKGWVLPKGGWETDEMEMEAAKREAWEEAGIEVRIEHDLGEFEDKRKPKDKDKQRQTDEMEMEATKREAWDETGIEVRIEHDPGEFEDKRKPKDKDKQHPDSPTEDSSRCMMRFFEAVVLKEHAAWPESHKRERQWMSFDQAMDELKNRPELQKALESSTMERSR